MNYKIIQDEEKLKQFINWLPELEDGQKYYFCLFARKKYNATLNLKSDKGQLKRGTASKDQLINKIKKLEVELGSYEIDGLSINQNSLALYITPNPRNMHKAGLKTIQELTRYLVEDRMIYNPQSVALNMIQVSGVKKYFDLDIDLKEGYNLTEKELRSWLEDKINIEAIGGIIKTRGGFHVLIELANLTDEFKKIWYNAVNEKHEGFTVMKNGDGLIPVPGCTQSDFTPYLL